MDKPVSLPSPPRAEQRPYSYERHGVTIDDPWHWLRDPKYPEVDDPDVLAYLKEENAFFERWKASHRQLIDQLFEEMKGRIKEDESSVPIRDGEWLYWWAFQPGAQYRTWYRRKITPPLDGEGQGWGEARAGAPAARTPPHPTLPQPGGGLFALVVF
jgi:oligopeptidase B